MQARRLTPSAMRNYVVKSLKYQLITYKQKKIKVSDRRRIDPGSRLIMDLLFLVCMQSSLNVFYINCDANNPSVVLGCLTRAFKWFYFFFFYNRLFRSWSLVSIPRLVGRLRAFSSFFNQSSVPSVSKMQTKLFVKSRIECVDLSFPFSRNIENNGQRKKNWKKGNVKHFYSFFFVFFFI